MPKIKRGVLAKKKHKKILKMAKGYYGSRSKTFKVAKQAVIKAGQYSYRDRKKRSRLFRKLWIIRINAASRKYNISYSRLINLLKINKIIINRKILSEIAIFDKKVFNAIICKIK